MSKMKATCLVLLLVLAYSYAEPDCNSLDPVCTSIQKCAWTCEDEDGAAVTDVDLSVCESTSTKCGSEDDEKCTPTCERDPVKPDCSALTCTGTEKCDWTCVGSTSGTADVSGCTSSSLTCGAGGVCTPTCVPDPTTTTTYPKSGSSRIELFTPLLVLGTLIRMCFSL